MGEKICIVRKGHMGDVIFSEPVAAALRAAGHDVALCTEYERVGRLLASYYEVLPYSDFTGGKLVGFDRVHELRYELRPYSHYLDAYAEDVGVRLTRRVPLFKASPPRIVEGRYGVIAPHTRGWMREMRTWPFDRYEELARLLPGLCGFPWRMLQPGDTFDEMMSLLANASSFVGNDSGPAVIAQSFSVPCVVIFGATNSRQVLFGSEAHGVTHQVGCNGCRHITRHTDIGCASPICIEGITTESVLRAVAKLFKRQEPGGAAPGRPS